ncbi:MAG: tetratricopeptide repeat protein [Silvanigrellales bacterium]|nr:tetratricopeptide repeat protein [Silvanigrellales bacterium]
MWSEDARHAAHFQTLCATGQWEQAESMAAARLRLEGDSESWLARHALCCMAQGRFAEALQGFDAAVCAEPTSVEALLAGCVVLADLGFYDEAAKRHEAALVLGKEQASGKLQSLEKEHRALARACLDAADLRGAQESIEKALNLRETSEGHRLASTVQVRQGRPDKALLALERARQLAPHDARVHVEAALCYLTVGRDKEARDALVRAETLGDTSATGHCLRLAFLAPGGH